MTFLSLIADVVKNKKVVSMIKKMIDSYLYLRKMHLKGFVRATPH